MSDAFHFRPKMKMRERRLSIRIGGLDLSAPQVSPRRRRNNAVVDHRNPSSTVENSMSPSLDSDDPTSSEDILIMERKSGLSPSAPTDGKGVLRRSLSVDSLISLSSSTTSSGHSSQKKLRDFIVHSPKSPKKDFLELGSSSYFSSNLTLQQVEEYKARARRVYLEELSVERETPRISCDNEVEEEDLPAAFARKIQLSKEEMEDYKRAAREAYELEMSIENQPHMVVDYKRRAIEAYREEMRLEREEAAKRKSVVRIKFNLSKNDVLTYKEKAKAEYEERMTKHKAKRTGMTDEEIESYKMRAKLAYEKEKEEERSFTPRRHTAGQPSISRIAKQRPSNHRSSGSLPPIPELPIQLKKAVSLNDTEINGILSGQWQPQVEETQDFFQGTSSLEWTLIYLKGILDVLHSNLVLRTRVWRVKSHQRCFVASDAVSVLHKKLCTPSRKEAVEVGEQLRQLGFIANVSNGSRSFEDKYVYFHWIGKGRDHDDPSIHSDGSEEEGKRTLHMPTLRDITSKAFWAPDAPKTPSASFEDPKDAKGLTPSTSSPSLGSSSGGDRSHSFDFPEELNDAALKEHTTVVYSNAHSSTITLGTYHGMQCVIKRPTHLDDSYARVEFAREAQALTRVSHPHIVQLFACHVPTRTLVLEYCQGGSLYDRLRTGTALSLLEVVSILVDVASALAYLHSLKPALLYRDLKSPNVLLCHAQGNAAGYVAKLADFGTCRPAMPSHLRLQGGRETVRVGTNRWMAPEILCDEPHYVVQSDVFSFGMLAWECLTRDIPFGRVKFEFQVEDALLRGERPVIPAGTHATLVQLLNRCWHPNPAKRISFANMMPILESVRSEVSAVERRTPVERAPLIIDSMEEGDLEGAEEMVLKAVKEKRWREAAEWCLALAKVEETKEAEIKEAETKEEETKEAEIKEAETKEAETKEGMANGSKPGATRSTHMDR